MLRPSIKYVCQKCIFTTNLFTAFRIHLEEKHHIIRYTDEHIEEVWRSIRKSRGEKDMRVRTMIYDIPEHMTPQEVDQIMEKVDAMFDEADEVFKKASEVFDKFDDGLDDLLYKPAYRYEYGDGRDGETLFKGFDALRKAILFLIYSIGRGIKSFENKVKMWFSRTILGFCKRSKRPPKGA